MGLGRRTITLCAGVTLATLELVALTPSAAAQTVAPDQSKVYTFDIPAGAVAKVLNAIGSQAGLPIVFDPATVRGKKASAVNGSMTLAEAIDTALDGTNLTPMRNTDGVIVVRPGAQVRAALNGDTSVKSDDQANDPTAVIIVVARQYAADSTDSATRTATQLKNIPQSVTVVSNAVMKSQQVQTVSDVLANVSGVSLSSGGSAYIRGFQAGISIDGQRDNTSFSSPDGGINTPIIGVQQVEVLKGPDSIIAGSMAPGGVINVVKKVPEPVSAMEFTLQGSTGQRILGGADVGGPLLAGNDTLSWRVIASAEYADHLPTGYGPYKNYYANAQLGWRHDGTDLVIGAEYIKQRTPVDAFTLAVDGKIIPYKNPITNPRDALDLSSVGFNYDFVQKLFGTFKFHSKGSYTSGRLIAAAYGIADASGFPDILYVPSYSSNSAHGFNVDGNITGTITTGPISNTVLAGFSYQWGKVVTHTQLDFGNLVFAPYDNPGLQPVVFNPNIFTGETAFAPIRSSQLYFQDQLAWGRLHLQGSITRAADKSEFIDQSKWLPSFGAVYEIVNGVSLYASYQRSYSAQPQTVLVDGTLAPPQQGKQKEIGAKVGFLGNKANATLSAFDNESTDSAIYVSSQDGYVLAGGGKSRGIEFDIQGEFLPGLKAIASFTHTKFTPDTINFGYSLVPRNAYSFWATYEIQHGVAKGLGFGGGIFGRDGYLADDGNGSQTKVPSQIRTDLTAFYNFNKVNITAGVKNVFDCRLYGDYSYSDQINVLNGRTFILTLGVKL